MNCLIGRDAYCAVTLKQQTRVLGRGDGAWCIAEDLLPERPLVVSLGVGADISFDREIHDRYGAEVHLYDPTPLSRDWIAKQSLPGGMVFHAYGIADRDGVMEFELPVNHGVSFSMTFSGPSKRSAACEVRTFASLTSELGGRRIDVLKMDIEGAEYAVLPQILESSVEIGQVLIEFHHRLPGAGGVEQTRRALQLLQAKGFRCFFRSPRALEMCFARPRR